MKENEITSILLENLQTKTSSQIFAAYLADIRVFSIIDTQVTIACKNSFTKQSIENRFFNTIKLTLEKILRRSIDLNIIIKSINLNEKKEFQVFTNNNLKSKHQPLQFSTNSPSIQNQTTTKTNLNPKYTFDSFIVGSHNQLAYAAATAIAEKPGEAYNPFFIYGGVGLGKTHLMQAIGNEVIKLNSESKVLYTTTETFLNEMVISIGEKNSNKFRDKYRKTDVLILDDIQFLSKKEGLQEEFYNTFNTLYLAGKQVVLASDRPPYEIASLGDRIRSRFEGGLVADIQTPNFETRIAILEKKLVEKNDFAPSNIVQTIAELIETNVRELEGALLKILLHLKSNPNLTSNEVRFLLGEKLKNESKKITPKDIISEVCNYFDVDYKDIKSAKRNAEISFARQISMYLIKNILNLPLKRIAELVGGSDHTTVLHGINKIEKVLEKDIKLAQIIMEMRSKISSS